MSMELRVCLTQQCNFSCNYCQPGGEGTCSVNDHLNLHELGLIIDYFTNFGVDSVRLTGGEPLLRNDFFDIVKSIKENSQIKNISIVTNGSLINEDVAYKIKQYGVDSVTVSLDTLKKDKFKKIVSIDCLERVINGLLLLRKNEIKVRINTVVMKSNIEEILDLIDFCKNNHITVKLLDLVDHNKSFWEKEFVPLNSIKNEIEQLSSEKYIKLPNGNFGTPMDVYFIDPIEVYLKDNTIGTCYTNICKTCNLYPCQSGIVSLILTHDGFLKLCTLSSDYNIDMKPIINKELKVVEKINSFIESYKGSELKNLWYKTVI